MKQKYLTAIIITFTIFQGCGIYSFTGGRIPGVDKIHVPLFTNATIEFGLEEKLTNAIINAINNDNRLSIADRNDADAVLEGRITRISDSPYTYDKTEQVSEYKVEVFAHIVFENVKTLKLIIEEDFSGWGVYPGGSGGLDQREAAIKIAMDKLAEDIIYRSLSGW